MSRWFEGRGKARALGLCLATLMIPPATAAESRFYAVEVLVRPQTSPPALVFSWPAVDYAREYKIRRKLAGDAIWGRTTTFPSNSTGFIDSNVALGAPYEYEVRLETSEPASEGGWINAYSYVAAGVEVAEPNALGKVILIVDNSIAGAIAVELEIFRGDLLGAGWTIVQREVSRTAPVTAVKQIIRDEYDADPGNVRSVILIGHVPVPYSGNIAPDLHASHRGAWPADAYYADMDGTWTDHSVNVRGEDYQENDNVPGDGKFDQSVLPSPTELELGRIDFWGLPAFRPRTEVDLLKNYFRKNHAFRHRHFTAPRQGLVRDNFGDLNGDAPAVDAWRHYGQFFGPDAAREVGPGEFLPTLNNEGFLWAYGGGGGANDKADGVGTIAEFAANDPRTVFLLLHGSYFGDWNHPDNFLRGAIATPSFTLASIWSGLPHWYLHPMALGFSIGHATRLTQNNVGAYQSHRNFSAGEVHVSLIGDPTLAMYPVVPPSDFTATAAAGDVQLRWSASSDESIIGYHLYYSISQLGPYHRITAQAITGTAFNHAVGVGTHYYMARAVKLERTGSGSYRNLSQGIFASVTKTNGGTGAPPTVTVTVQDGDAAEFRANSGSFLFTRDSVDGNPLTISFSLGGDARNGVDYMPANETIEIEAGKANALLLIYPRSDNETEGDESVTVQLKSADDYRVGSPSGASFKIRDNPVNQPPSATALQVTVLENTPEPITLAGSDPEGANLQFTITSFPSEGTLSGTPPTLFYEPRADATGADAFAFTVSDGALTSAPATVAITIHSRPLITSLAATPAGIRIRFKGPPDQQLVVEAATDTVTWSRLGDASSGPTGEGEFLDAAIDGVALKFYRLEWNR
jgi:hypothetical protein